MSGKDLEAAANGDAVSAAAAAADYFRLAPFNPSSQQIQEKALEHLKLSENDVLFDLGCGDGRLLCHAVKQVPGLRCVGIEIDPIYVERAMQRLQELPEEAQSRIEIRCQDALSILGGIDNNNHGIPKSGGSSDKSLTDLTLLEDATALYLFVLPNGLQKLLPLLETVVQHKQQHGFLGFRILSYMFRIHHDNWEPTKVDRTAKGGCPIYYYEWNGKDTTVVSNETHQPSQNVDHSPD